MMRMDRWTNPRRLLGFLDNDDALAVDWIVPTPSEIRRRAAEIRLHWTDEERRRRARPSVALRLLARW